MAKSFFGVGELNKLADIIDEVKARRVFLVTGRSFYESLGLEEKIRQFVQGGVFVRYSEFSVNPQFDDVIIGLQKMKEFSPDLVVGLGGGSVLDMAKLLSIFYQKEGVIVVDFIKARLPLPKKGLPLVLIPTTAGSGSEATHFAVVYLSGQKFSVSSKELLPDFSILDPELTYTAPSKLTAVGAFDALAHAIESHWAVSSSEESRKYSASSIKIIMQIFDKLISNPDKEVRKNMLEASHLSGEAINLTKTTAAHALSYEFTMRFGLPHGQAVMLSLPKLFRLNALAGPGDLNFGVSFPDHKKRMNELCVLLGEQTAEKASLKLEDMFSRSGLKISLNLIGSDKENEIVDIVSKVNLERLSNNPVKVNQKALYGIVAETFL